MPLDPLGDGLDSLAAPEVEEMAAAWRRGERPRAEDILARHPGLDDEAAIRLIYEEVCLRQEAGLPVDPAEVADRFPRWRAELELLLDCHRLMEEGPAPVAFPEVGEEIAGFRLLAELGRGGSGRVFLAEQAALADRPVVLKVGAGRRGEHLSLARLQHMNIMPLYSEHPLPDRGLQVLCMPYLGGATLARALELLADQPPERRTGAMLVEALDRVQASLPASAPTRGPFRQYLARASYVEAVGWIGACLADGLQYAHDRGLVHMDIKPSNVLLAGDGQPLLLDFHLARGPLVAGAPAPPWIGGTPEFMAPEQQAAVAAVRSGRPVPTSVDGRADVYALGLLLDEALGGPGSGPLHRRNNRASPGLSDILARCLRPDPRDRYLDAAALAADLRRHLSDLPLRGVANRSLAERWGKWRRRRPTALSRGLVRLASAGLVSAAAALLWAGYRQRIHDVDAAQAEGRAELGRRQYPEAVAALRRGVNLARNLPGAEDRRRELDAQLALAVRDARAAELHRLADLVRFRYGLDPPPAAEAESLLKRGRAIWQARESLARPVAGHAEPDVERALRADLLDFALVWADLRVRTAPPAQADEARREALRILDEADALLGPSPALDRDRRAYASAPGSSPPPAAPAAAPRTAWEHYHLGRSYLRSGEVALASDQFQAGLDLRPQDFWLNFYQGLCAYRLGRPAEAADAFRICVALSPETPECSYNLALAHAALGQRDRALGDYTRALGLNPRLIEASLNRGILHYQAGRLDAAASDLRQALANASDPGLIGTIRYNLALVDLARGDRPSALADLAAAARLGHEAARDLQRRLRP
jgi:serine/threonine protein kinase/Flp pilus assembly protein TadD